MDQDTREYLDGMNAERLHELADGGLAADLQRLEFAALEEKQKVHTVHVVSREVDLHLADTDPNQARLDWRDYMRVPLPCAPLSCLPTNITCRWIQQLAPPDSTTWPSSLWTTFPTNL